MTDDNLPDCVWITGRYVCYEGDMYQTGKGLEPVSEKNGHTKYHHTRQYTGLERDVERLHDYNTHLVNENERLRAALDLAYKMHCDPCNMPEKDIQQIEQALKETT